MIMTDRLGVRLEYVHASVFALGTVATLFGILLDAPLFLVLAGLCFVATGALIALGSRITLGGPLGNALRLALGRSRILTIHLRAVAWLLLGALLVAFGIYGVRSALPRELPPEEAPIGVRARPAATE